MRHFETKFLGLVALLCCTSFVVIQGDLNLADYSEGSCWANISQYMTQPNPLFILTKRNYYVPMGAKSMYISYVETIDNKTVADDQEIANMNLQLALIPPVAAPPVFNTVINTGNFLQLCPPTLNGVVTLTGEFNCVAVPSVDVTLPGTLLTPQRNVTLVSSAANAAATANSKDTIIMTDNQTYVLIVRCINFARRDWKLLRTTAGPVPEDLKTKVLAKVQELGFNMNNLFYSN